MTNLSIAFLIIITAIGGVYAFMARKMQIGLGLSAILIAFILAIPDLATGFFSSLLLALSLIIYAIGIFIIIRKKKDEITVETIKNDDTENK